jgi:PleD family two-component response regulator
MALQTLVAKDGLTGLVNRRCFDQALQAKRLRAQRAGKSMALLFVDVDHFKPFSDRHGYGGEEFVIILPATGRDGARKAAAQIRKKA